MTVAGGGVGASLMLAGGSRGAGRDWWLCAKIDPRAALLLLSFGNWHILVISNVAAILTARFAIVTALVAAHLVRYAVCLECCFLAHLPPFACWPVVFACIVSVTQYHQPVNLRYDYDTSSVTKRRGAPGTGRTPNRNGSGDAGLTPSLHWRRRRAPHSGGAWRGYSIRQPLAD